MASTFDLHVLLVLYDGWQLLARNEDAFVEMLPRMPDSVLREWHRAMTGNGEKLDLIRLATSFNLRRTPPPCWIVQLNDETDAVDVLGHVLHEDDEDGVEIKWMMEHQVATITSIANNKEVLRAMHVTAKALLLQNIDWFRDAGYAGTTYVGGGDLSTEESLAAELGGMFLRTQSWRCQAELEVKPVARIVRKPYLVAAADVVVDGVQGGALPKEQGGS